MKDRGFCKWKISGGIRPGEKIKIIKVEDRYSLTTYEFYKDKFERLTDKELIGAFNEQVGNGGTGTVKMRYLYAIHREFIDRDYDFSAIGDEKSLSFARKVKLVGKKVVPID